MLKLSGLCHYLVVIRLLKKEMSQIMDARQAPKTKKKKLTKNEICASFESRFNYKLVKWRGCDGKTFLSVCKAFIEDNFETC